MNKHLLALSVVAAALGSPAFAEEMADEQYQALEARLAQLEARDAAAPAASALDKIKINGFLSAGFGWADTADGQSYDTGLNSTVTHTADSVAGLQVDAQVNERTRAVMQLVGRGTDNFDAGLEWAYISWRPTDADEFRIGRQRDRLYLLSEYLEVGYAYPWARPPVEMYRADHPSAYDGLSWQRRLAAGAWQHDVTLSWGRPAIPSGDRGSVRSDDNVSLGIASTHGNWQFGAELTSASITVENSLFDAFSAMGFMPPSDRDKSVYATAGLQYDNGSLLVISEFTNIEVDGTLPDSQAAYLTVGYRFGKFLPHVTYSGTKLSDGRQPLLPLLAIQDDLFGNPSATPDLCPLIDPNPAAAFCLAVVPNMTPLPGTTMGIPFPADTLGRLMDREQQSVTVGVRYDFLPNAALKLDWTRVLDTNGTLGFFTPVNGDLFNTALPEQDVDVVRAVVDVVF